MAAWPRASARRGRGATRPGGRRRSLPRPSGSDAGASGTPSARCRARQAEYGLTFAELRDRCLVHYPDAEETLRRVLRDEVARGRVDYSGASRRYRLNGGPPADVRLALRDLEL